MLMLVARSFRLVFFFFTSRRRHTRPLRDWSSDVCSSDLHLVQRQVVAGQQQLPQRTPLPPRLQQQGGQGVGVDQLRRRSEERRVGKECRSRWSSNPEKKKKRVESEIVEAECD